MAHHINPWIDENGAEISTQWHAYWAYFCVMLLYCGPYDAAVLCRGVAMLTVRSNVINASHGIARK